MNLTHSTTDLERRDFLKKLDASELLVTEWEARFIASFFQSGCLNWFTPGRRSVADKLRLKYGGEPEIKMPFALKNPAANLPAADPAGCQFLLRGDGSQKPCNEPANRQTRQGFRYCDTHAEQVQADLRRRGAAVGLLPFEPRDTK
jgi:hypothetical protein